MKSRLIAIAIVFAAIPALAWAQAPCNCGRGSSAAVRPASYGVWADYQPAGMPMADGVGCSSGCGGCMPACRPCCNPCCRPLLCIIPNTIRRVGQTLDCILCGPRNCGGCGTGSCSMGVSYRHNVGCCGGVPSSGGDPFQDDIVLPAPEKSQPTPPKPMTQETRREPSRLSRDMAAAPAAGQMQPVATRTTKSATRTTKSSDEVSQANLVAPVAKKPVSVLKRTSATMEDDEPVTITRSSRRSVEIPHNPLR